MPYWEGDEVVLHSAQVEDDFCVTVALPHRYDPTGEPCPVVVALDAHWLFGTVRDLVTSLGMGRHVPRAVVVGVGYPTTDLGEVALRRHRDATPTAAAFPAGGNFGSRAGGLGTGGADRLRAFLVDELRPWLVERHRLRSPWVLVGHSMTALFGVHTLVTEPTAFDAYLLASPSLWWDDRVMLRDSPLTRPGPELAADVYVSAGGDEDRPGSDFAMAANARRAADLLAPRVAAGHRLTFEVIDGETHHSTIGAAVSRGLRALLGTPG